MAGRWPRRKNLSHIESVQLLTMPLLHPLSPETHAGNWSGKGR